MAAHVSHAGRAPSREHLDWPFLAQEHRELAHALDAFVAAGGLGEIDHQDADVATPSLVGRLGGAGFLRHCVPAPWRRVRGDRQPALCVIASRWLS